MTVQELIDLLNKIEDKNKTVLISIHTQTQRYPVAYTDIQKTNYLQQAGNEVRLYTCLPDNMHTVERKKTP